MKIEDMEQVYDAVRDEDVEAVLAKRYGDGVNAFWLSQELGGGIQRF